MEAGINVSPFGGISNGNQFWGQVNRNCSQVCMLSSLPYALTRKSTPTHRPPYPHPTQFAGDFCSLVCVSPLPSKGTGASKPKTGRMLDLWNVLRLSAEYNYWSHLLTGATPSRPRRHESLCKCTEPLKERPAQTRQLTVCKSDVGFVSKFVRVKGSQNLFSSMKNMTSG